MSRGVEDLAHAPLLFAQQWLLQQPKSAWNGSLYKNPISMGKQAMKLSLMFFVGDISAITRVLKYTTKSSLLQA